jgi:glycosyltransferase XagB
MKITKRTLVSVIIPVYNEAKNVKLLHKALVDSFVKAGMRYELLFVDDHSTDRTRSIVKTLAKDGSTQLLLKNGKKGKAFSLMQGFAAAKGDVLVMIDADLQYPPTAIPEMVQKLHSADVIVANRKKYHDSPLRRIMSKTFRYAFGKTLFDLELDIQSGLKVFTKEVIQTVSFVPSSGWTFDLEFLHRARQAGFVMKNHDIVFSPRQFGKSSVKFLKTTFELGINALSVKFKKIQPFYIPPTNKKNMIGAGVGFKKNKYITHTTLPHEDSAMRTFEKKQIFFVVLIFAIIAFGLITNALATARIFVAVLSIVYFIDVMFNLYIISKSLRFPNEVTTTARELHQLQESVLPRYTILCPLYKEAHVVPQFIEAISQLDYPKQKLEVMLLLEEDDTETILAIKQMKLPSFVRIEVVPYSLPKTKPKACNYGLSLAKGEYVVIYDAEDIPDPLQLKKAYIGFQKASSDVICLQAKLNYYNPSQNLLTRFFTAEYSLWFDVTLPGLQAINSSIPLGGTSNHFRTADLKRVQAWDPFNVTEDADLGVRLFKAGFRTAIIDSTTFEEANSKVKNWIRQRSRWLKGYMQTYLVHLRKTRSFAREKGVHALVFQLTVGGKLAFILINPFLWVLTVSYFTLYSYVGPTIELLYLGPVLYLAVLSLILGNFLFIYYYMIGCAKRNQWHLIKYIYLIPLYWFMISAAAVMAFYQLIFKPHYWEKTVHGLHLQPLKVDTQKKPTRKLISIPVPSLPGLPQRPSFRRRLPRVALIRPRSAFVGLVLIAGIGVSDAVSFLFHIYIGRTVDYANFALFSLATGFMSIMTIPWTALLETVNYRSGFLEGRYGIDAARAFYQQVRMRAALVGVGAAILFVAIAPLLHDMYPQATMPMFVLLSIAYLFGFISFVDRGYLYGRMLYGSLGLLFIAEPVAKLLVGMGLVQMGMFGELYLVYPIALLTTSGLGWVLLRLYDRKALIAETHEASRFFPKKFFSASLLSGLSVISFLGLDVLFANLYLDPVSAGKYALISLTGKIIFFVGNIATQFIIPAVSRREGLRRSSANILYVGLLANLVLSVTGYIALGLYSEVTVPLILGDRGAEIASYLLYFLFGSMCFTVSRVYVSYYQVKRLYSFAIASFVLSLSQMALLFTNHQSIGAFVEVMFVIGGLHLLLLTILHLNAQVVQTFEANISMLLASIRGKQQQQYEIGDNLRILLFNWRDTKHKWAGGAEVYVHELAKHWVQEGHDVTLFCGSDGKSPRKQVIDGVEIIRSGGHFTVYLSAFFYYMFVFRGQYDVVIDTENGIPFFSSLYVRKPVFLLIHHVHQEVFRQQLRFPMSALAQVLESKFMPLVYRNKTVITVSESSKQEIIKLGFTNPENIHIIHNGIDRSLFTAAKKTIHPSFMYLGRLKKYKNIDVAIKAFSHVVSQHKHATLDIVGEGESLRSLKKLVSRLQLDNHVVFHGRVSERKKAQLLASSWVMLQPSMMEGWGITVLEANASGTPVIASRVNGLKDSVIDGQTGILVKPKSEVEFAAAMNMLVTHPRELAYFSQKAMAWAQNFSWDRSAFEFLTLIERSLLSGRYQVAYGKVIYHEEEQKL